MPREQEHAKITQSPLLRYHFGVCTPMELLDRKELSERDKLAILRQWDYDAIELMVAEDENMGGGQQPASLSEIREAMRHLLSSRRADQDANADETTVGEVMTKAVKTVHPDNRVREVARRMKNDNVGLYVVVDGDTVAGVITDRDIALRAVAGGLDFGSLTVADVMTNRVVACPHRTSLKKAADIMIREGLRRLCVVDDGSGLVGIVSLTDLALGTDGDATIGRVLRSITRSPASGISETARLTSRHTDSNHPGGLHVYDLRPVVRS